MAEVPHTPETAGYVLAGGKSTRFGRDKALVEVAGVPLVRRVAEAVREAAGRVTLAGAPEKYGHLGYEVIPDPVQNAGPLAGLAAALAHSRARWNLIAACDMPHFHAAFGRFLLEQAERLQADVLMPVDAEGREHPLCAVYRDACREPVERRLAQGTRKVMRALEGLRVVRAGPQDYGHADPEGKAFTNANTPEELRAAGLWSA